MIAARIDRLCLSGGKFAALPQTIPEAQKSGEAHFFDSQQRRPEEMFPPADAGLNSVYAGM